MEEFAAPAKSLDSVLRAMKTMEESWVTWSDSC